MEFNKIITFFIHTKNSFKYAIEGFLASIKSERNMKIHITFSFVVIVAGFILKISQFEWITCLILFGAVISSELLNTAFENIVDLAMPLKNEKAKLAKDIAASAVLVWAVVSAIVGIIIFLPKVILYLK